MKYIHSPTLTNITSYQSGNSVLLLGSLDSELFTGMWWQGRGGASGPQTTVLLFSPLVPAHITKVHYAPSPRSIASLWKYPFFGHFGGLGGHISGHPSSGGRPCVSLRYIFLPLRTSHPMRKARAGSCKAQGPGQGTSYLGQERDCQ